MPRDELLQILDTQIAARAASMTAQRGAWPCHKGCDHCCRSLAAIPQLAPPEWHSLREGLLSLPTSTQQEIAARLHQLHHAQRPITCPFLDPHAGACLVYNHRPIACRTYGFYVERHLGLYCTSIQQDVDAGLFPDTIWGNAESIHAQLATGGAPQDLLSWFLSDADPCLSHLHRRHHRHDPP